MDPTSLATIASGVVSLLSALLKKKSGESDKSVGGLALEKASELFRFIKTKFARQSTAREILDDLTRTPEDPDTQASVRAQLKKTMLADEEFAKQLADFLKEADEAGADAVFNTTIHGNVKKLVQIGNVYGDVTI